MGRGVLRLAALRFTACKINRQPRRSAPPLLQLGKLVELFHREILAEHSAEAVLARIHLHHKGQILARVPQQRRRGEELLHRVERALRGGVWTPRFERQILLTREVRQRLRLRRQVAQESTIKIDHLHKGAQLRERLGRGNFAYGLDLSRDRLQALARQRVP